MVSKARLDLPEPESPVTTMRLSRGISTEMFLRLCTRAPCTAIVVRAALFGAVLGAIRWFSQIKESHFLHLDVALLGELHWRRGLADETLVGQVLARRSHAAHAEVALEVALDLAA